MQWADARGPQKYYAEPSKYLFLLLQHSRQIQFCSRLPFLPPRPPSRLQQNIFHTQLYGRALDRLRSVDADMIRSRDGSTAIAGVVSNMILFQSY